MRKTVTSILSVILTLLLPCSSFAQIDIFCKWTDNMIPELSNSVCRITFTRNNKTYTCTGILLNNEKQDRDPLVLTARHCITDKNFDINLDTQEIEDAQNSAVFRFRQRRNVCGGTSNEPEVVYNGATFLAANFYTDFALFRIAPVVFNQDLAADLNYAGWSRSDESSGDLRLIAHPHGDPQKYARGHKSAIQSLDPWKYSVTWDEGGYAAEEGGSGGALISQFNRVIGALSYGNPGGQSGFGKFSKMWDSDGAANRQLKAWLSPTQNLTSMPTLVPMQMGPTSNVCYNQSKTFTLPNLGPSQTGMIWTVSPNLTIVSSTYNSVTVKASSSGGGGGIGQISNQWGPTMKTRDIWYGTPDMGSIKYNGSTASNYTFVQPNTNYVVEYDQSKLVMTNMTNNMNWNPMPGYGGSFGVNFSQYSFNLPPGQVLQFNPVSATNSCGTSNRSMAFESFSSFAMYPNPTTETLYLKFDNSQHLEGLPEDISIYEENSGKMVKQLPMKDVFERKLINDNVLAVDVKDFPRGTYYVHVRPNKNNKKEIDKIRVVFK